MDSHDIIIVGCGLSGAVLAERYANFLNKRVLIIEKRDHVGGNCYDYLDPVTGIRVSKYGPHFFHTDNEKVWRYIQNFSDWIRWESKVVGRIGANTFPIPVNITTVNTLLGTSIQNEIEMHDWLAKNTTFNTQPGNSEDAALAAVGKKLYELIFRDYTKKHWGVYPDALDPCVIQRVPVRTNFDTRYFTDKYQALPAAGYTRFIENMLDNPRIKVLLNTDFLKVKEEIKNFKKLYFTGPIDHYYRVEQLGQLEYRSLRFEPEIFENTHYYQKNAIENYPSLESPFTRIVEYKHILHQASPHTIIFREYGTDEGEPFYPVMNEKNRNLYEKFKAISAGESHVYFVGRLGNFKYINMDQAILNSLEIFEQNERIPIQCQWKEPD